MVVQPSSICSSGSGQCIWYRSMRSTAADGIGLEALADFAPLVPDPCALGENVRRIGEAFDRAAHNLVGMPEVIDRG